MSQRHRAGTRSGKGAQRRDEDDVVLVAGLRVWRAGLRINEALVVTDHDLDPRLGAILVRHGKGGRRREVGMDPRGWDHLRPWLELRIAMPVGPLLCVIDGTTRGRPWASDSARAQLRRVAAKAGVRRRFAPHQLRHAHAVELAHEGVPLNVIQRQLGHTNLGVTSLGIDNAEIIATVHARTAPMLPPSTRLRLRWSPLRRRPSHRTARVEKELSRPWRSLLVPRDVRSAAAATTAYTRS